MPSYSDSKKIVDFVSTGKWQPLDECMETLSNWISDHNLSPLFYWRTTQSNVDLDMETLSNIRLKYLAASAEHLKKSFSLERILAALAANGIPVIPLKGLSLAESYYSIPALRPMCDIDILIPTSHAGTAVATLSTIGFQSKMPFDLDTSLKHMRHLPPMTGPGGVKLDVHTRLGTFANGELSEDNIWKRSVHHTMYEKPCRLLAIEDNLLFLVVHIAEHEFSQCLIRLYDLALLINQEPVNWEILARRARLHGSTRKLEASLYLAYKLFHASVPQTYQSLTGSTEIDKALVQRAFEIQSLPSGQHRDHNIVTRFSSLPAREKIRYLAYILFSTKAICGNYGVAEKSSARYLYVIPRCIDLFRRSAKSLWFVCLLGKEMSGVSFHSQYEPVQKWLAAKR